MKAIRIHQHGGPEVLQIDDLDIPVPKVNEVLIKIKTVALNHLDLWVRKGFPGIKLPLILGSDGAGIIEEFGSNSNHSNGLKKGDHIFIVPFRSDLPYGKSEELSNEYRVLGEHLDGVQAEYICAPVEFVMPKPENLTLEKAAAFPLAFLTAYHMIFRKLHLNDSQTILIWGASSGIGTAAIQISRHIGAKVISTAGSEEKLNFALQLGADHCIDYKKENVGHAIREITDGKGVDAVFDHVGEKSWTHSIRSLKKGGKIVTCGATTGPYVRLDLRHLFIKHQQIIGSTMGNRKDLTEICELIERKVLDPIISRVYDIDKISAAHRYLEENRQMGKVVLTF